MATRSFPTSMCTLHFGMHNKNLYITHIYSKTRALWHATMFTVIGKTYSENLSISTHLLLVDRLGEELGGRYRDILRDHTL